MSYTAGVLLAICIGVSFPAATLAISATFQQRLVGASNTTGKQRVQISAISATGIINGTQVADADIIQDYSFFALPTSGVDSDNWLGCGASIISPTWGVTASHCFGGGNEPCTGPKNISLWVGDLHLADSGEISGGASGKHVRVTAEIVCHPQFNGKCSNGHDITLLHIHPGQALPDWVKPVPLNLDNHGTETVGTETTNIGFGYRETVGDPQLISSIPPSRMRKAELTIYADDYPACASVYAGGYGCSDSASEGVATNMGQQLCAGAVDEPERDTCSGDSGSPMLDAQGVQIGIVSYGGGPGTRMSGAGRICADPDYMGVYTRISAFADHIRLHVKDLPQDVVQSTPSSSSDR